MAPKDNKKSEQSPQTKKRTRKTQKQYPEAKASVKTTNRPKGLTVVGIGASAGGLKALQTFFDALPDNTGMAFVVITHLHPSHESHMAELLQSHTSMPVNQVVKVIAVEPNHVYVIPPNRSIILTDSHLDIAEFEEPRGHRTPIDWFFRSLASSHSNSVGIILSGGGTDGSIGIKAIKEEGGLLMVQHPDDAEYDSMPRAAIATGLADVVLPVQGLAEKLVEFTHLSSEVPIDPDQLSAQQTETIQHILAQVHARTGNDFSQYKRTTILRRIQRRMQLNSYTTLDAYLDYLRDNAIESVAMFNDILIGVTSFFRDPEAWDALAKKVIPAIFEGKESGESIRAWTIGCATGEEAYTLAILLLEHAATLHKPYQIQIFASDLVDNSLERARDGIYPAAIEADVSPERLERFFIKQGHHYQVRRELREIVLFTNHSVFRDPPFSRQHIISCRNLLIYLKRELQDNVFDIFHYALHPDGYLFLGGAESAVSVYDLFHTVDKTHRLYQAQPSQGKHPRIPYLPLTIRHGPQAKPYMPVSDFPGSVDKIPFLGVQHQIALETIGPPSLLVNHEYAVLHISERAGRFLVQPGGPITSDLLKLVRVELQSELRSALFQAFEHGKAVLSRPVDVQFNGKPHPVVLSVHPRQHIERGKEPERQALVVFLEEEFHKLSDVTSEVQEAAETRSKTQSDALAAQLEAEVWHLREQLQTTAEEYVSASEEMKAANEELQSINEEYRSATEELETSKEELQSLNEELQTLNNELKQKVDEISRTNSDLENLMDATKIATLFLDRELNIRRFTPGTEELFNIRPFDLGRPIADLTHKLGYGNLVKDAREVLHKLVMVEHEAMGVDGEWFLIRLRPYRTGDNKIDGVVISFIDITAIKKAEEAQRNLNEMLEERIKERTGELDEANQRIRQARDMFHMLFHANPIPSSLTRLEDGLFMDVNDAYLEYYGLKREAVIGHTSGELGLPLEARLRPGLIARVRQEGIIRNLEMKLDRPSGETRTVLVSLQQTQVDSTEALISTFTDITQRVHSEQQMRDVASSLTASEQVERHRISRILHDDLQQNIFAVKMQLTFLGEALEKNNLEGLQLDLKQLDEWLAKAITTTRQLSVDLSPPILQDEGLAEAIIWLAAQMKEQYKLHVSVQANGFDSAFEEDIRVLVFQSVRELLFNVVKHSGVLQALVTFQPVDGKAHITVSDQGDGFDSGQVMQDRKVAHGLLRMRDRLYLLGCNLIVESQPNNGTKVTIEAPIKGIID